MRDFWVVTTCQRPGLPSGYLPTFLELGGASVPLVVCEDLQLKGQAQNFLLALEMGVEAGAERIHTFEDDVLPSPGAFDFIARQDVPSWATWVAWYDGRTPPGARPGWRRAKCPEFFGLQAVTFPRASALAILEQQRRDPWPLRNGGDLIPQRAFASEPNAEWAMCIPSLFQHGGKVSICNPGVPNEAGRTSRTWLGPDFDVRTLPVLP